MSETKRKIISICIPTYNRASLLIDLLDSIARAAQKVDSTVVEICISDNASDDGTDSAVHEWKCRNAVDVVYHRWPQNMGAGNNFVNAAGLAGGKYIWLMGSDDAVQEDALEVVLDAIGSQAAIYLTGRVEMDSSMRTALGETHFIRSEGRYDFSDENSIKAYLGACCGVAGLFSYLSSLIVNAGVWQRGLPGVEQYTAGAYPHVYVLLNALQSGGQVQVIRTPIVKNRNGNDSFLAGGNCNRVLIDIEDYLAIFDGIPPISDNPELLPEFHRVILRERPLIRTLLYLRHYGSEDEWARSRLAFQRLGVSNTLLGIVANMKWVLTLFYRPVIRKIAQKVAPYRRPGH
ncbi:glycosyltransferase family 2 protein [Pandoraea apista]|uniref:glycosyltransferase family 2 protein n=1 Tax=Pandoraea apista TaxID=93218 RepID=UPI000657D885|nr:glycosyltransferase family 2 protein [Pandoraea apista]CFB61653.1 Abequosyltransferase RfbV [Pandoraea apista]